MEEQKTALTKAIAILLSVTPETLVGKLLKLCLEAKVEPEVAGKSPLQMAQEFIDQPESLPYWMQDIIAADGEYKAEEWEALGELGLNDTEEFLNAFWKELESINIDS